MFDCNYVLCNVRLIISTVDFVQNSFDRKTLQGETNYQWENS